LPGTSRIVVSPAREVQDYVLQAIVELRHGGGRVTLIAYGENVCMLADVVARLQRRLGRGLRVVKAEIDSRRRGSRRESYLLLELEYDPYS